MSQPSQVGKRMEKGDEVVIEIFGQALTKNELHAMQLGSIGFLAGIGYANGFSDEAVYVTMFLIASAIGANYLPNPGESRTMAVMTVKHEPWWFIISYIFSAIMGYILIGGM